MFWWSLTRTTVTSNQWISIHFKAGLFQVSKYIVISMMSAFFTLIAKINIWITCLAFLVMAETALLLNYNHTNDLFTTLTTQTNQREWPNINDGLKLTNQFIWTGYGTLNWQQLLTDSDDVVRSGYRNVSQQYRLKSISGLLSLRQLDYMIIHI